MKWIKYILPIVLFGCTTTPPEKYVVNGTTKVYTTHKLMGVPYSTDVDTIKTPQQAEADLQVKAMEDRQENEAKRGTIAVWLGGLLFVLAVLFVVVARITQGWKRWGGLAITCASCGALMWGFVEWIHYLKWLALALPLAGVALYLYDNKDKGRCPKRFRSPNETTGRDALNTQQEVDNG